MPAGNSNDAPGNYVTEAIPVLEPAEPEPDSSETASAVPEGSTLEGMQQTPAGAIGPKPGREAPQGPAETPEESRSVTEPSKSVTERSAAG